MAECTPNFLAAYEAAETTPRSFALPPTTTGLPLSEGSRSSSTETKKASMSTWKMVRCIRSYCRAERRLEKKRLSSPAFEEERAIRPAEAEGVAERVFHTRFARVIRDAIEIALGVLIVQINGRRQALILQRQNRDASFESAGAAEQVPGHRFRGADGNLLRMFAEKILDGLGFEHVTNGSRRPVRVDVADLVAADARVFHRFFHHAVAPFVLRSGLGDVIRVPAHAIADNLCEYVRAALFRTFKLFQDQDPRALADDEAVASLVERTAGLLRFVVAGGEGAHGGEPADTHRSDGCFCAAGDHHVGGTTLDDLECIADGVC